MTINSWANWKVPARTVGAIGLATFGVFGFWSAVTPISSAVVIHGVVTNTSGRAGIQSLEGGVVSDLLVRDNTEVRRGDLLMRIGTTEMTGAASQIIAPFDGKVVAMRVTAAGDVASPGKTLLEVVPLEAKVLIKSRVSPIDVRSVSVGMDTEVRFPAITLPSKPMILGKVVSVSADSLTDQRTGQAYYELTVSIPDDTLLQLGADPAPSMPAEVIVIVGESTVLQYLTQPLANAFKASFGEL